MKIEHPAPQHLPLLKQLWMEAFEDTAAFVDLFYLVAFAPERGLCVFKNDQPVAVAYWFDVCFSEKKAAYVYAVATAKTHQGQGICRNLMAQVQAHLAQKAYAGIILVPGDPGLREMYAKMGYADFGGIQEFSCAASGTPLSITQIPLDEYAALRAMLLPEDGVVQEGANLDFLKQFYRFYRTDAHVFAAASTGCELFAAELLGDPTAAPGILAAFGVPSGVFRIPGQTPFAMYHSLDGQAAPSYFAFAFD